MRATPETHICRAYLKVVTSSDPERSFFGQEGRTEPVYASRARGPGTRRGLKRGAATGRSSSTGLCRARKAVRCWQSAQQGRGNSP